MDPINLQWTYPELLAEIGAKQLIIQRQATQIAELEAALAERGIDRLRSVPAESNGTKPKGA